MDGVRDMDVHFLVQFLFSSCIFPEKFVWCDLVFSIYFHSVYFVAQFNL